MYKAAPAPAAPAAGVSKGLRSYMPHLDPFLKRRFKTENQNNYNNKTEKINQKKKRPCTLSSVSCPTHKKKEPIFAFRAQVT